MEATEQLSSTEWERAFCLEATPKTMQAALRCATIEVKRLNRLAVRTLLEPADLLQHVVAATWARTLAWRAGVVPLRIHLLDGIRDLGRRLWRQADAVSTTVSLNALDEEDPVWNDAALTTAGGESTTIVRDLAGRFENELWSLAEGDQVLLRVLRALTAGATSPAEIVLETGLPPSTIESARRRLRRLAGLISPDLLADIRAELNIEAPTDSGA